jgi:NNP family nitrate/nitrite transporter-like MFS transporter
VVFVFYLLVARDAPECPPPKSLAEYLKVLKDSDAWWFMFFYSVTFGGFVGLASSLTIYFNIQYGLDAKTAGFFTAACVFAGSMVRPIGGNVADRIGGIKSLSVMYVLAAIFLGIASIGLPTAWMALLAFVGAMLALGMGNGAVFQLVPQRFRKEIGVMTGLVGMAGGVGGFYLASSLGYARQITGSYQMGLLIFAALAMLALAGSERRQDPLADHLGGGAPDRGQDLIRSHGERAARYSATCRPSLSGAVPRCHLKSTPVIPR